MSAPRTAKEAIIAEMLGDIDKQATRLEQNTEMLETLRARILTSSDKKFSQSAKELDAAASRLSAVTTRSVDDFVFVANEALAKFTQLTHELKATLESLNAVPPAAPLGVAALKNSKDSATRHTFGKGAAASIARFQSGRVTRQNSLLVTV